MKSTSIEFTTTPEILAAAKRIERVVGDYFTWNCALQISVPEDKKLGTNWILNYHPRHGVVNETNDVELFEKKLTKKQLKDFCLVNAAVIKNLGAQFKRFSADPYKEMSITYPNCSENRD